jgi:hypothetical protein
MITTGFIVFMSLIIMFFWLPWKTKLWLFGKPLYVEIPFGVLAYFMHWGTVTGMFAAAVAVMMAYIFMRTGKKLVGSYQRGKYLPGLITIK